MENNQELEKELEETVETEEVLEETAEEIYNRLLDGENFDELMEKYNVNVSTLLEVNGIERQEEALDFVTSL